MTRFRMAGLVILAAFAGTAGQAAPAQVNLYERLSVGAHVYFPDGRRVSTWRAFDRTGKPASRTELHSTRSLCVFSDALQDRSSLGYGWQFDVRPVSDDGTRATVRVTWSRNRFQGAVVTEPMREVVISLMPGQSVPLDYVVPNNENQSGCDAIGMMLDISVRALNR